MNISEIKSFLDEKTLQYNNFRFIETDPIQVPRSFSRRENIEISGFLAATIAWGNRASIIKNARRLMSQLDNNPYDFLMSATDDELNRASKFVHRTFNPDDTLFFLASLKNIYKNCGGLEAVFTEGFRRDGSVKSSLEFYRTVFLGNSCPGRTRKHISDVTRNSAAKRLNMFLRWMVRKDDNGVDFGLWDSIPASALMLPLDVHTGNTARKIGLLKRMQNDWKAVEEITAVLRDFDPLDPVKYDFALFGLGVFEKF
ncbi:MAG: TIGR02757 family protein [Prolixibacteraceae bacterium]|nr:TIGR02757 family protein [Prolixibacteraceae bacterium]